MIDTNFLSIIDFFSLCIRSLQTAHT